jgi:hypothetical protein
MTSFSAIDCTPAHFCSFGRGDAWYCLFRNLESFFGDKKISHWDLTKGLGFLTRGRTKGPWRHRDYRDQKFFGLIARGPTDCSNVCKSLLLINLGCGSWIDKLRTRKRTSEIIKIFRKEKNVTGEGGHSSGHSCPRKQKKRTGSRNASGNLSSRVCVVAASSLVNMLNFQWYIVSCFIFRRDCVFVMSTLKSSGSEIGCVVRWSESCRELGWNCVVKWSNFKSANKWKS